MFVLNAKLCNIYALILEVFGGLNLFLSAFFLFFLLKKFGLMFNSPRQHCRPLHSWLTPCGYTRIVQYHYLSVSIRDHVVHSKTSVHLINVVSNLIFHRNNCDVDRVFVTFRESTAVAPSSGLLNTNLCLRGRPPPIIFARIVRPVNALQRCRWQFSHKKTS